MDRDLARQRAQALIAPDDMVADMRRKGGISSDNTVTPQQTA